ncbi:flagellin, partial [Candidatus Eisenbacteria bacterium]
TRSQFEDLDLARATIDFQKEQAILEAALSTTAQLMQYSLVNFLR